MSAPVPDGYLLRHALQADTASCQRVLDAAESADCGEPRRHEARLAIEFRDPQLDLGRDVWVVTAPVGPVVAGASLVAGAPAAPSVPANRGAATSPAAPPIAAVGWVWPPQAAGAITADLYVDPEHRGRGLHEVLLDAIEGRAAEHEAARAARAGASAAGLVIWAEPDVAEHHRSLETRGFAVERQYYEMRIDLDEDLERPVWPAGIAVRTMQVGRDEPRLHLADNEAFAEHHLFEPRTFEEWRLHHVDRPDFDPGLWPIGWDGEEIAGYAAAFAADDGGYVADLAVRAPWRGRGLGLALLLEEFRALGARGATVARLTVDAQNATGAVELYRRAGMRVARRFDVLVKRPASPRG